MENGNTDIDIGDDFESARAIPGSINYSALPNRAINHEYIAMTLYPTGSYSQQADSVVRFKLRMDDDLYWDPYSAYLQITISFEQEFFSRKKGHQIYECDLTEVGLAKKANVDCYKFIQLDSSATNMIGEYIAYDVNTQLYRLYGLDVLHTMLKDLNYGSSDRISKAYEGYGGIKTGHVNFTKMQGRGTVYSPLYYPDNMSKLHPGGGPFGLYNEVACNLGWNPNGRNFSMSSLPDLTLGQLPTATTYPKTATDLLGEPIPTANSITNAIFLQGTKGTTPLVLTANPFTTPATIPAGGYNPPPNYSLQQKIGGNLCQATINVYDLINPDFISAGIFDKENGRPIPLNIPTRADVLYAPDTVYSSYFGNDVQLYESWDNIVKRWFSIFGPVGLASTTASNKTILSLGPLNPIWSRLQGLATNPNIGQCACYYNIYGCVSPTLNFMSLDQNGIPASLSAYPLPFNETFCSANFEHLFSDLPLMSIIQGQTGLASRLSHQFIIPLPCVIWGCYTPPERYKLVPMKAFKDPWIEIRFTKDAFFTSWWTSNLDYRRYTIESIQMRTEMAQFYDRNVQLAMQALLSTGITINTTAWQMALMQSIPSGAVPTNVQINVGFDSLRKLLFCYLSQDYLTYASSRKQWRVNQSLSSYYVKVGTKYIPSQPIMGSASTVYGNNNCMMFYYETLKAFNKHLGRGADQSYNPFSFAWQYRPYFNQNTYELKKKCSLPTVLYPPDDSHEISNGYNLYDFIFGAEGTNADYGPRIAQWGDLIIDNFLYTGTGQKCYYYENAFAGKAMYAIDLDSLNYENYVMSGISTVAARPFDIVFTVDQNAKNKFERSTTLYVFGNYDLSIVLTPNATLVFGLT